TKRVTQRRWEGGGPSRWMSALAGSCLCTALPISAPIGIVCRCSANNRGVMGGPIGSIGRFGSSHCGRGASKHDSRAANYGAQAHHHFRYSCVGEVPSSPYLVSGDGRNHAIVC